ncbi:MAG: hypothetical protein HC929_14180, partial [Leptolyngbyaceae cyanobacterium SM2_5_2]|nr:hypothetical protein [Leptolyngbyaceae cyanobacterium SM2_5_2]
ALRREDPERVLYLAVPDLTYNGFFQLEFPAAMLEENLALPDLWLKLY